MVQDASRPCIGYSGNKTRLRFLGLAAFDRQHVLLGGDGDLVGGQSRLAGISAGVGLTPDDLLGEPDQHPLCPMIF
jgi:hypothetical protein